jgi:hypothetical protein
MAPANALTGRLDGARLARRAAPMLDLAHMSSRAFISLHGPARSGRPGSCGASLLALLLRR